MGNENPIRTLGDYSKPSHEGYRNTIELPVGNNVVPFRSDAIWLVQNGCSFHGLRSEDPNQHLKDFLKLADSLDLNGENRERTRLRLFQFSLCDQASNWLEHLPARSISIWEDLTTRFLAQFFPLGRTAKLRYDILMFQQHHGESLSKAWTQDLALYDNKSWNDLRDFTKVVKAIALPQDVPSTSDRRLIELENQVQRLMEAHLALTQPTQVNKITTQCEICSGPYDTYVYIEDPEQACVDYASSRTNEMGSKRFTPNQGPRSFNDATNTWKEKPNFNWAHTHTFTSPQGGSISIHSSDYQMKLEKTLLDFDSNQEKRTKQNPSAPKRVHFVNSIVILSTDSDTEEDDSSTNKRDLNLDGVIKGKEGVKEQDKKENEIEIDMESDREIEEEESKFETDEEVEEIIEEEEDKQDGENFNSFPTMEELTHHEWILKNPRPPWVKARIRVGNLNNIKISCMVGHFFKRHAYIDLESPINIMSRHQYN
ncbi:MAK10-like protein [Tanacetum coccineum]